MTDLKYSIIFPIYNKKDPIVKLPKGYIKNSSQIKFIRKNYLKCYF